MSKVRTSIKRELSMLGYDIHFDISTRCHSVFSFDATVMKQFHSLKEIQEWIKQEKLAKSRWSIDLKKVLEKEENKMYDKSQFDLEQELQKELHFMNVRCIVSENKYSVFSNDNNYAWQFNNLNEFKNWIDVQKLFHENKLMDPEKSTLFDFIPTEWKKRV